MLRDKKIAFLGGGNMAEALIKGLIAGGAAKPDNILVADVSADRLAHLHTAYGVVQKGNVEAARGRYRDPECEAPGDRTRSRGDHLCH